MNGYPERYAYREAGVNVSAGDALVDAIRPLAEGTRRPGYTDSIGGFGAAFDLAAAGYKDPLLVSATDGVGTKLRIAIESGQLDTIGIDLVAMCVNDLVCHGAEPLFFLDYFATGRLAPEAAKRVIAGVATGCRSGGLALVGGETAEMPGLFAPGEFDLAGFAVGAVERDALLPKAISIGDSVVALLAEGPHANGFSLIRKIAAESGLAWGDRAPFRTGESLGEALLEPTTIYVEPALALVRSGHARALAHITGGGLIGNLPRILSPEQAILIDLSTWFPPPVFQWIMSTGNVTRKEMLAVFNCGIGMVAVCPEEGARSAIEAAEAIGFRACRIGAVVERRGEPVVFADAEPRLSP